MPLVVLAVLLFSGNIVNMSTYLYVEYIEFVDDEVVLFKDTDENVYGQVKVNVFPLLAGNKEVEFRSENPEIVSVSDSGKLTGYDFGSTYIYATSKENSTKSDYIRVIVTSSKVHRIWIEETSKNMYVGDVYNLSVKYAPADAVDTAVEYVSSNTSVATVDRNGKVTVVGGGDATITISLTKDSNIFTTFTLSAKPRLTGLTIADRDDVFSAKTNFAFPTITLLPSGASEEVSYRISEDSPKNIASIDDSGNIVFESAGTIIAEAYVEGTDFSVKRTYTSTCGKFTSIAFSLDSPTDIDYKDYVGRQLPLKFEYAPLDADASCLTIDSSNTNVISCEAGVLTVLLGGKSTITISGMGVNGETISASSTININRTSDKLAFTGDKFNIDDGNEFVYFAYFEPDAGKDSVTLDAKSLPQDANDQIYYALFDENGNKINNNAIAYIVGDNLYFGQTTKELGYTKVKVMAYTDSGVKCEVIVAYVDEAEKIDVGRTDITTITRNMPLTGSGEYNFALVDYTSTDFSDIKYSIVSGADVVTQKSGAIFTLANKGEASVRVDYYDDQNQIARSKVVNILVSRLVEKIEDITVKALWQADERTFNIDGNNNEYQIYSSAPKFDIGYTLYPSNTTLTGANISLVDGSREGIASISGNTIVFTDCGYVRVKLEADNGVRHFVIRTTYLHPDNSTKLENIPSNGYVALNKGESINDLFEYLSISPYNIDKKYISFSIDSDEEHICLSGSKLTAISGNSIDNLSKVTINIDLGGGETKTLYINVYVVERASGTKVKGSKYYYVDTSTFDLTDKFLVSSPTANTNLDIIYSIDSGNASIVGNLLRFKSAGRVVIKAMVGGHCDSVSRISVVYVGESMVVDNKNTTIINGAKVLIKPTSLALEEAEYSQTLETSTTEIEIVDQVFAIIKGSGSVTFGDDIFVFTCLEQLTSSKLSILPSDSSKYVLSGGKYLTADTSLKMKWTYENDLALEYVNNGYMSATYSTTAGSINNEVIAFGRAGEYLATITLSYDAGVVGGSSIHSSINISTTMGVGQISTSASYFEVEYNENDSGRNYIDIKDYLTISPKPLVISADTISLEIKGDWSTAHLDDSGLKVNFYKGGTIEVVVNNLTSPNKSLTISFRVNRYAKGVTLSDSLGSYSFVEGQTDDRIMTGNRATMYISPICYPTDANVGTQIEWEMVAGYEDIAFVPETLDRIVFTKANSEIELKFTIGGEKVIIVKFKTEDIMFEVDLDILTPYEDNIIVTQEEVFTFISKNMDTSEITITRADDTIISSTSGTFKVLDSFKERVCISDGNVSYNYLMISASNMQNISADTIKLKDKNMSGEDVDNISTTSTHITASKSIEIKSTPLSGYGVDGEPLAYSFSVDDGTVASVSNAGLITFTKAGTIKVTICVTYKTLVTDDIRTIALDNSSFSENVVKYEFEIKSTFGNVTEFGVKTKEFTYLYDDMPSKVVDIISDNIIRIAPIYGLTTSEVVLSVSGGTSARVVDRSVEIVGSGITKIDVAMGLANNQEITINVNKKIDNISILENGTNKQIFEVVTKASSYLFKYDVSGTPNPNIIGGISVDFGKLTMSHSFNNTTCMGEISVGGMVAGNRYCVTINDSVSGKNASLYIICIESGVDIIEFSNDDVKMEALSKGIIIEANQDYIIENRYSQDIHTINSTSDITINDIGVFEANYGSEGTLMWTSKDVNVSINYVAIEYISAFNMSSTSWVNGYETAMGSRDDDKGISLDTYYGASFLPVTAGTYTQKDGKYVRVPYKVKYKIDGDSAYIEDNKLYFTKRNEAVIINIYLDETHTFARTLTSTLGYANEIMLDSNFMSEEYDSDFGGLVFNFGHQDISIPQSVEGSIYRVVAPSDAYKLDSELLTITSMDTSVATIDDDKIKLVGGGETVIKFNYNNVALDLKVYVVNRATNIGITYNGEAYNYIVTNKSSNESISISYDIVSESKLSPYTISYKSSNLDIATVDSFGRVCFKGTAGKVVIEIGVSSVRNEHGTYDATDTITILNNPNFETINVSKGTSEDRYTLSCESIKTYIIYPNESVEYTSIEYSVSVGKDIISIDNDGIITLYDKGGYATIQATAFKSDSDYDVFVQNVYVWKRSSILDFDKNNVVTASTTWQINPITNNDDGSMVNKTLSYTTSDSSIATVNASGGVTFLSAGEVNITVAIMYNGKEEISKTFNIRSTYGRVERFELYQIDTEDKEITSNSIIEVKSKEKNKLTFEVRNIYPSDCKNVAITFTTNSTNNYTVEKIGSNKFTIKGNKATVEESFGISVGDSPNLSLKITVVELAEKIDILLDDEKITGQTITVFNGVVTLGSLLNNDIYNTVSNKTILWKVVEGGEYATIDEDDKGNCVLTINKFGNSITLRAMSGDKECQAYVYFVRSDITDFDIVVNEEQTPIITSNSSSIKVLVDRKTNNKDTVTVDLVVSGVTGFDGWDYFTYSSLNGSNIEFDKITKTLSVSLKSYKDSPEFNDVISITYDSASTDGGKLVTKKLEIYRDGISSVEFYYGGTLMNGTLDKNTGLQQMLVFGTQSYYDGVKDYYNMSVKTTTIAGNTEALSGKGIVWTATNSSGNAITDSSKNAINFANYYNASTEIMQIPTSTMPICTPQNMYDDAFDNGAVTITASDIVGGTLFSYTFHFVDGVNVWNAKGFNSCGTNAVLHCDLGHDDELSSGLIGEDGYYNAYSPKTIVYGNGHLINLNARDSDTSAITKWDYINYENPNWINTIIKGGNNGRSDYHVQFGDARKIAYCEVYNMFRAVELGSGDVYIKNSLLRNFVHSVVNASNNNDNARNIYLENTIMFDVGKRAIEVQSKNDTVHITGIFDVYNFQDQDDLNDAIEGIGLSASFIMSKAEKAGLTYSIKVSEGSSKTKLWANFFCLATKSSSSAKVKWYQNGFSGGGTEITDSADGGINMKKLTYMSYGAWAFKNTHSITWYDEFDGIYSSTATKKTDMIKFTNKLCRSPQ